MIRFIFFTTRPYGFVVKKIKVNVQLRSNKEALNILSCFLFHNKQKV